MYGKIFLISSILIAVFIGNHFSNLYIPDDYERPHFYKVQYTFIKIFTFISKLAQYFEYMDEIVFFKHSIKYMETIAPPHEPKGNVSIIDDFAEDIKIRIFYKTEKENSILPAFIYYHGGGYALDYGRAYDIYLNYIAERLDIKILAIFFRTAPEFPYPIPVDDCWRSTNYIIDNAEKFKIDTSRLIIGGDSAGGGLSTVITQRLSQQNKTMPKLQIFIYPWLQMLNFGLPSSVEYKNKTLLNDLLSLSRFSLVYFGKTYLTNELINILDTNQHSLLIDDQELKIKYKSYLSLDLIPKEYKDGRSYYSNFNDDSMYPTELDENSPVKSDLELKKILKMLTHLDLSPSLADDSILKLQPKSYFIIFEWDVLKDENLIYAERLKRNGVHVDIAFYEKIFHGGALFIDDLKISRRILDNMIEYMRQNV